MLIITMVKNLFFLSNGVFFDSVLKESYLGLPLEKIQARVDV